MTVSSGCQEPLEKVPREDVSGTLGFVVRTNPSASPSVVVTSEVGDLILVLLWEGVDLVSVPFKLFSFVRPKN